LELCKVALIPTIENGSFVPEWKTGCYFILGQALFDQPMIGLQICNHALSHVTDVRRENVSLEGLCNRLIANCDCQTRDDKILTHLQKRHARMVKYMYQGGHQKILLPTLSGLCLGIISRVSFTNYQPYLVLPASLKTLENVIRDDYRVGDRDRLISGEELSERLFMRYIRMPKVFPEVLLEQVHSIGKTLDYSEHTHHFSGLNLPLQGVHYLSLFEAIELFESDS